ncbi:MAG TPA: ABC transporter permease [Saprospiraceae bacterium]|nr:ABC transporter permease [Saprospiraceae bacterium]
MNKTLIVAKREFATRALKKKFLLITLFMPLIIAIFSGSVGFIMSYKGNSGTPILLVDPNKIIPESSDSWDNLTFTRIDYNEEVIKKELEGNFKAAIVLPEISSNLSEQYSPAMWTVKRLDLQTKASIEKFIQVSIKNKKLELLGLDKNKLDDIDQPIHLLEENISGKKESGSEVAAVIGGIFGFFLYLLLTINGSMIMRSVMEEKTNRIIEVMISTVTPKQLMFGKIIGVGLVGLFQILIWCITTPLFIFLITFLFAGDMDMSGMMATGATGEVVQTQVANSFMGDIIGQLQAVQWWVLIPTIFLFFLLGYLMYSSMFAAIGSTMGDDQGEGQSLTFLVIMPLLFGFYISMAAISSPNSSMAVWSSIIPLFSPIVMPVRLAFDPPVWQIVTSLISLALSSWFFAWLSARIYRVGILMYGKKATFKDMVRWFKAK